MLILLIGSALSATVGSLAQQARHGSLTARGEAIIALSAQRSPAADAALRELHEDEGQDMLVRTWAAAARIQQATSLDELLALSELLQTFPALARPIRLQRSR